MTNQEQFVLDFLHMMTTRTSADELDQFYHPDVEQIEYPNAVTRTTATRTIQDLKAASEKGRTTLLREEYVVKNLLSVGETVVLECTWLGTVARPAEPAASPKQLVAHFAQIFEFKDGRIYRQRNYDCFEPLL